MANPHADSYRALADELLATGIVSDPWLEGRPRFGLDPLVFRAAEAARYARAAEAVAAAYDEAARLCAADPWLVEQFFPALTPFQHLMWSASGGAWHGIARADVFATDGGGGGGGGGGDGVQICELNCDTPSGEAEAVLLNAAVAPQHLARAYDPNVALERAFVNAVGAFAARVDRGSGRDDDTPPTVGILYPTELVEDLSMILLYRRWLEARGCRVVTGSPFNLARTRDGGVALFDVPCDVIVRHYKTDWWSERKPARDDDEPFDDAEPLAAQLGMLVDAELAGRLAVMNPWGSVLCRTSAPWRSCGKRSIASRPPRNRRSVRTFRTRRASSRWHRRRWRRAPTGCSRATTAAKAPRSSSAPTSTTPPGPTRSRMRAAAAGSRNDIFAPVVTSTDAVSTSGYTSSAVRSRATSAASTPAPPTITPQRWRRSSNARCPVGERSFGARWWRESLGIARLAYKPAMGTMGLLSALSLPACATTWGGAEEQAAYTEARDNMDINVDSLALQRDEGWDVGQWGAPLAFAGSTDLDAAGTQNWRAAMTNLAGALAPTAPMLQPYYVPTLFQSLIGADGQRLRAVMRPMHTPEMDEDLARGIALRVQFGEAGWPKDTALVIDAAGPRAVAVAASLADRFAPIFTFGNWPHPLGVVPAQETLAASLYYLPMFAAAASVRAPDAPPMFVLDANRLAPYSNASTQFDNRYFVRLRRRSSWPRSACVTCSTSAPMVSASSTNLNASFVMLCQKGIEVKMLALSDFVRAGDEPQMAVNDDDSDDDTADDEPAAVDPGWAWLFTWSRPAWLWPHLWYRGCWWGSPFWGDYGWYPPHGTVRIIPHQRGPIVVGPPRGRAHAARRHARRLAPGGAQHHVHAVARRPQRCRRIRSGRGARRALRRTHRGHGLDDLQPGPGRARGWRRRRLRRDHRTHRLSRRVQRPHQHRQRQRRRRLALRLARPRRRH